MIKVVLVPYPLSKESKATNLAIELNKIERDGGTILYITSDSEGYTVVYREKHNKLFG